MVKMTKITREGIKVVFCDDDAEDIRMIRETEKNFGLFIVERPVNLVTGTDMDDLWDELAEADVLIIDMIGKLGIFSPDQEFRDLHERIRSVFAGPIIVFSGMPGWEAFFNDGFLRQATKGSYLFQEVMDIASEMLVDHLENA